MILLLAAILNAPCNADPVYILEPQVSAVAVRSAGQGYLASAQLEFRIVERTHAVISSKDPGLQDHARGHRTIAQRVAQSSVGSVRATGNSAAQARMRLQQAITRLADDAQRELYREEHVYDSVTENGAAQSQGPVYGFPGGPDARDTCAQP